MTVEFIGDIRQGIRNTLQKAATATGVGFDYLLKTAVRESGLKADAKARTSSAAGMFQFIEQTWLQTMKESGSEFGLQHYADKISRNSSGRFQVANAADRKEILDLRFDAGIAAKMAGAFTAKNNAVLKDFLGRDATEGELYIAHFMGAQGARQLLSVVQNQPERRVDDLFPQAASANRSIFYNGGKPRSAQEVYANLVRKHDGTQVAPTMAQAPSAPLAPSGLAFWMQPNFGAQNTATTAPSASMTSALAYADTGESGAFHSLFSANRTTAVSPYVQHIWGGGNTQPSAHKGSSQLPLELFSFLTRNVTPSREQATPVEAS